MRKQLRGVDLVNVPDLASNLDTGFIFGKVLFILHKHKFITWKSVEQTVVADTISRIRSPDQSGVAGFKQAQAEPGVNANSSPASTRILSSRSVRLRFSPFFV